MTIILLRNANITLACKNTWLVSSFCTKTIWVLDVVRKKEINIAVFSSKLASLHRELVDLFTDISLAFLPKTLLFNLIFGDFWKNNMKYHNMPPIHSSFTESMTKSVLSFDQTMDSVTHCSCALYLQLKWKHLFSLNILIWCLFLCLLAYNGLQFSSFLKILQWRIFNTWWFRNFFKGIHDWRIRIIHQ